MPRPFPAYEGDEPYVFVCYSHDDSALVYPELIRLRDTGFNLWYDEGIAPGSEWSETLARHIRGCAAFLYFVSPRSVASEHCRREVNFLLNLAEAGGLLAVHLEPTDLPDGLMLSLSNRQAILKYEDPRPAYESKLARAVRQAQTNGFAEPRAPRTPSLGDWRLDVGTQRLRRGNEERTLDPKALSVLLHLIDRVPEVVERDALIARTWPDVVVGDNVLDQAIAQLRRAFGDDARNPRYIETLPRRGYRLIPTKEWTWLADALTFELTDDISEIGWYHVVPRAVLAGRSASELPDGGDLVLRLCPVEGRQRHRGRAADPAGRRSPALVGVLRRHSG